jgi:toxin CcdB
MGQFAVHKNGNARTRADVPFLLDVQADVLSVLATRAVVPLYRAEALGSKPMAQLTPLLRFQGKALVAMVPELAGVPRQALGAAVGDLAVFRGEIIRALDLLLTGF